jgi:ferredoxin
MRVTVDEDLCQGHTLCASQAPEVFLLREDDGHAYVEVEEVPVDLEERVERAVETCPERAIQITR